MYTSPHTVQPYHSRICLIVVFNGEFHKRLKAAFSELKKRINTEKTSYKHLMKRHFQLGLFFFCQTSL